jgi:hypothetical protein
MFDQDTKLDALLKIISFQYVLAINNDNTCNLNSILNGSFNVSVNRLINAMTLSQNTGRKSIWYVWVHIGHVLQHPVVGESSEPVDKYNSPQT